MFYVRERKQAADNHTKEQIMTLIQDGATQKIYLTPNMGSDQDLGSAQLKVKLVGTLVHGACIVIDLIPPWIADDAWLHLGLGALYAEQVRSDPVQVVAHRQRLA